MLNTKPGMTVGRDVERTPVRMKNYHDYVESMNDDLTWDHTLSFEDWAWIAEWDGIDIDATCPGETETNNNRL